MGRGGRPNNMISYSSPPSFYQFDKATSYSTIKSKDISTNDRSPVQQVVGPVPLKLSGPMKLQLPETVIRTGSSISSADNFLLEDFADEDDGFTMTPEPLLTSLYNHYDRILYSRSVWVTTLHDPMVEGLRGPRSVINEDMVVSLTELRKICWKGIPTELRSDCWKYLFDYSPVQVHKRESFLMKRREEYRELFDSLQIETGTRPPTSTSTTFDATLYHQIEIDLPRTQPGIQIFKSPLTISMMQRILYFWAIRHPASGYVQGLNDILAPILVVFLTDFIIKKYYWKGGNLMQHARWAFYYDQVFDMILSLSNSKATIVLENATKSIPESTTHAPKENPILWTLTQEEVLAVEADIFFCFGKLLEPIQDRYTVTQPSIFKEIQYIINLLQKIDPLLIEHFRKENLDLTMILFRWLNCLCLRELPFKCIIRLWDTCLSESLLVVSDESENSGASSSQFISGGTSGSHSSNSTSSSNGFQVFYTFFMVAFLRSWSKYLLTLDFQVSYLSRSVFCSLIV